MLILNQFYNDDEISFIYEVWNEDVIKQLNFYHVMQIINDLVENQVYFWKDIFLVILSLIFNQ